MKSKQQSQVNEPANDTQELRKALRAELRKKRNQLTVQEQELASQRLSDTLLEITKEGDIVALYFANDGELSPNLAIHELTKANRKVAVPVMHSFRKGYLNFQLYDSDTSMTKNSFGIEEPTLSSLTTVPLSAMGYLFMPLVGFDAQGNRLGMGGGFYDRTLCRIDELEDRPKLIGLAHDCQQVEQLPIESWDVAIDMIITSTKKVMINSN